MPEVIGPLRDRRARRAFDIRPVAADVRATLWEAVSLAPSHGNAQPTRLVAAAEPPSRARLFEALSRGNREWAGAAPLLVAVTARPADDSAHDNSDGTQREMWAFHAGIATGNLITQATALGLVAHPMAGYDEPAVRAALGIPLAVRVIAVVAIGYPGATDSLPDDLQRRERAPQRRLPLDHLVGEERWTTLQDVTWKQYRESLEG